MLKTNSKQAIHNIKKFIMLGYDEEFDKEAQVQPIKKYSDFSVYAYHIYQQFYSEKIHLDNRYKAGRINEYDLFEEWVSGLCGIIYSDYYYRCEAVKILGDILEETEEEKSKYSEEQAEKLLTRLIYRTIKNSMSANKESKSYKILTMEMIEREEKHNEKE